MREVKISMETKKQDKLINITKDNSEYYCTVTLPDKQLIKFTETGWSRLINKLGHLLIAMTPDIEHGRYVAEV